MTFLATRKRFQRWLIAGVLCVAALAPRNAAAHGELLIRIGEATRKIESATNNLAPLYLARGELYREDQNWTAAAADYDRAEQLDPKLGGIDFCRAKMLDDSRHWKEARELFGKVIAHSPENGEAFLGRARVLVKLHESKPAIEDFRHGLKLLAIPKPEYFLELGQLLAADGRTNEALASLDAGIARFGPLMTLQRYALELELARKNHEGALARLDSIIARAGRKESWLARRGEIALSAGRAAEAKQNFEASLAEIKRLPMVLQKAAPMQQLRAQAEAGLKKASEKTGSVSNEKPRTKR